MIGNLSADSDCRKHADHRLFHHRQRQRKPTGFRTAQVNRTGRRTNDGSGNGFGADAPTRATSAAEPATAARTSDASDPWATSSPAGRGSEAWAEPVLAGVGAGDFGQPPF